MRRRGRVVSFSKAIICIAFAVSFSSFSALGNRWDSEGAAQAFQDAERMRNEISQSAQPSLSQYTECARTYRKVHVRDPHYGRTGDAIYQEAIIYQEMGDRFANPEYYKTAVKRFQLLIRDYGGNRNCPEALVRMGDIYKSLNDEVAAQNTYEYLKKNYRGSAAARKLATGKPVAPPPLQATYPPAAADSKPTAKPPADKISVIQSIRHFSSSDDSRVIIDLDSIARYVESNLSNPDRIYFDIAKAKLSNSFGAQAFAIDDQFLKQIRISLNNQDAVRVVLDLSAKSDHTVSELSDPFRIVIDLRKPGMAKTVPRPSQPEPAIPPESMRSKPVLQQTTTAETKAPSKELPPAPKPQLSQANETKPAEPGVRQPPRAITQIQSIPTEASKPVPPTPAATSTAKAKAPVETANDKKTESSSQSRPAEPTSLGNRTLTRMLGLKIGKIVIDPGHGGHDLGTIGPGGLLEKNLVLSIALDLQNLLQDKLGAQVILTRTDDTFVSLEERSAIANRFHADLFVSIHANSSRSRSTSGVETYYLNFAKTDAEREIASRENATSAENISELEDLIKKIAQADKSTESKELASIIQDRLYAGVKKMFPAAQNRGVRSAPFIVLIGANMPSVLTEVAFISNPRDERLLKKATNQERLVKALFSGIEDYMKTLGSDMAQNGPHTN